MRLHPNCKSASIRSGYAPGCGGFTLVEVLVVIGVFAVLASVCYVTLTQYLNTTEALSSRIEKVNKLDRMFSMLERDLRYAVNRPGRSESSGTEPAMVLFNSRGIPGEIIRITTVNPDYSAPGLARIQRVAWYEEDGVLFRTSWDAVDLDDDTPSITLKLLEGLESTAIEQFVWSDTYGLQTQVDGTVDAIFPQGLQIDFSLEDGTVYTRVFDLFDGLGS
jgi:type II secretion system protein J